MTMWLPEGYGFFARDTMRIGGDNIIRTYGDYLAARTFRQYQINRDYETMEKLKELNGYKEGDLKRFGLYRYVGDMRRHP